MVYASDELTLAIQMAKSDLVPAGDIRSTATTRRFINMHLNARLKLPIATSPCVSFTAPSDGVLVERIFRGLLACITKDSTLHVWDIRRPDAQKVLTITEPGLIDIVIDPESGLLVLLCYRNEHVYQLIVVIRL